ncbi:MAG: hypothetical protein H6R10_1572 [Rhodocyclaceae bacterium]|nr:hypothetical protein [Rhodocyclaceae bacterium]
MARRNISGQDDEPARPPGHGTADLGPSDTSDSGSDIRGGQGLAQEAGLDDDTGNTSDMEHARGAGPDLGDANLDSDSDSEGTGERTTAGRDSDIREGGDIAPDQVTRNPGGLVIGEDPEGIGVTRKRGK